MSPSLNFMHKYHVVYFSQYAKAQEWLRRHTVTYSVSSLLSLRIFQTFFKQLFKNWLATNTTPSFCLTHNFWSLLNLCSSSHWSVSASMGSSLHKTKLSQVIESLNSSTCSSWTNYLWRETVNELCLCITPKSLCSMSNVRYLMKSVYKKIL